MSTCIAVATRGSNSLYNLLAVEPKRASEVAERDREGWERTCCLIGLRDGQET